MMAKRVFWIFNVVREGKFLSLLIILLVYILSTPFLEDYVHMRRLYNYFLTAILLASLFAVSESRTHSIVTIVISVFTISGIWIAYQMKGTTPELFADILAGLFLGFTCISIIASVFRTREVTRHVIFAAISAYILIAYVWSTFYSILETLQPGSFSHIHGDAAQHPFAFTYYSFVTITTLGYGDITPLTSKAQALAVLEAIIGQIYMTVLIAWLVGLYVGRRVSSANKT
jgi:hypothetical protein